MTSTEIEQQLSTPPLSQCLPADDGHTPPSDEQGQEPRETSQWTSRSMAANTSLGSTVNTSAESRAAQLRKSIAKLQAQIEETQKKLDETCGKLEGQDGGVPAHQSSRLSSTSSKTSPSSESTDDHASAGRSREHTIKQAQKTVANHIKMLTKYNELKDVSMGLLGMIAEAEGKRLQEVMEERGIEDD